MVKKQTLAVFAILLALAAPAFGLGLGDIKVSSNLNDPLDAEIKLIQLQGLTAGEILPTLASNDDFRRAGVERSFFLSNIQFRVQENAAGELVVGLTTKQAVREPFLNFLVELNWPGGRLLKEYTILLDPPVFDSDLSVDSLVIESITTSPIQPVEISTSTVVEAQSAPETTPVAQPAPTRSENLASTEYRVQRNDTLWEIALKVPDRGSYSPQQVMLAIQDLNPSAFLNNNINRLKAGSVLELPSAAQIATRSLDEAISEVQAQNRGAAPNLRAPVNSTGEVQLSASDSTSSALPGDDGDRDPDGYLELAADSESSTTSASGEAGATIDQLQSQLAVAEELNDQFARERDELESRVAELQEQIAIMERMINVQSSDMAEVQQALTETNSAMDSAATESPTASENAATPAAAENTATASAEVEPAVEPVSTPAPVVTPAPAPVAAPAPSFMDRVFGMISKASDWVMSSVTNMGLVAGGLLLLILLPLYIRSKRDGGNKTLDEINQKSDELDDMDDFDSEFEEDLLAVNENDDEEFDAASDEPETLDAVVEAEMYMAYQKYDQAEEKLKEALAEHPDRADVGLKLLEVYSETGNTEAFNELESRLALTPAQKESAFALRDKLPMAVAAVSNSLVDEFDNDDLDLDGLPDKASAENLASSENEVNELEIDDLALDEEQDGELDFKLDFDAPFDATPPTDENSEEDLASDFDFELDLDDVKPEESISLDESALSLDNDESSDDLEKESYSLGDLDEDEGLELKLDESLELDDDDISDDLDFSLEAEVDGEEPATTSETEEPVISDDDLTLDLSDLDEIDSLEVNESESLEADTTSNENDLSLDGLGDLDLDIDEQDASVEPMSLDVDLDEENDVSLEEDMELDAPLLDVDENLELDESEQETEESEETEAELESEEEIESFSALEPELDFGESDADNSIGTESFSADESDLDFGLETQPEVEDAESEEPETSEPDALQSVTESLESEAELEEDEFDFLSGTDEASTKLDLARAYIEMEDKEGARDILEEVVVEGTDEQKALAQELISKL